MTEEVAAAEKSPNAWAQAATALVLIGALGGGLWVQDKFAGGTDANAPAVCPDDEDAKPSKRISGAQLCTALNRTDLPALLGTPKEQAQTAYGSDASVKSASGTETATPEATVKFDTYTVQLSRSYDDLPVAGTEDLLNSAESKTILGHPAVLYSSQTIAIRFNLGGGESETGPGGTARSLVVAPDPKDSGGSYELAIWRQDTFPPDDAALLRVAEKVLPTIPGWTAAG
ncbi:DUF6215 domain-containing protein [Streptomyces aurantiogriseus]|uniref:Uncharacterized protein n=1 Tax=Streptomyces aurantiogriseus TaxID=66870 RepID=A0A918CEI2_9ACTN|nr:DUF6215 domain-containing protein [Streptomyces aurantiogriseus]GGR18661.1 hypothetical protein GCM10010251_38470 [Streptomyces aurantiogriseus]